MSIRLITELPSFTKKAAKIFDSEELVELRDFLKENPEKGDVIQGTGGLRKMRWTSGGKGKRGGARVIYFYHVVGFHIYLMACYAKNEQEDLRPEVKKQLKSFVEQIKKGV
jgi:mRNA-degrading endonuclease RelE of RelBE toxin-antitoxin system